MEQLLKWLADNPLGAFGLTLGIGLGVGGVYILYIIGEEHPDDRTETENIMPVFKSHEEEIAWHEEKVRIKRELLKEEKSIEQWRNELSAELKNIREEIRTLQSQSQEKT